MERVSPSYPLSAQIFSKHVIVEQHVCVGVGVRFFQGTVFQHHCTIGNAVVNSPLLVWHQSEESVPLTRVCCHHAAVEALRKDFLLGSHFLWLPLLFVPKIHNPSSH